MSTLREIQLFELQMLKELVKVCEDNGIRYMLSSGTLLGAVRHKGFIPWDDDIDVSMPLKDYEKFISLGPDALGEKYFVQNYRTDNDYNEMWTQIRANGTTSMPKALKNWDIHFGVCIDIFPLVGYSDDPEKQKKQRDALALNRTLLGDKRMKALGEKMTFKQKLLYSIPRGLRKAICKYNEKNFMLDTDKYDKCIDIWYKVSVVYPVSIFSSYTDILFEDAYFCAPEKWDEYLTVAYGDYMKLPDEKDRGTHDLTLGEIIIDLQKDYKEYK